MKIKPFWTICALVALSVAVAGTAYTIAQEADQEPLKKEAPKQEVRREIQRFKVHFGAVYGNCQVLLIQDRLTKSEYLVVPGTGICPISKPRDSGAGSE